MIRIWNGSSMILRVIWLLMAISALKVSAVNAQDGAPPPPPVLMAIDDKSVNLASGQLMTSVTDIAIGPNDHHGLQYVRQWTAAHWRLAIVPTMTGALDTPVVSYNGKSYAFTMAGDGITYVPDLANGSTLSSNRQIFTSGDGMVINFSTNYYPIYSTSSNLGKGTSVVFPDGTTRTFTYQEATYDSGRMRIGRLLSITSSTGYQIKIKYLSNTLTNSNSRIAWSMASRVTAINNAVEYCDPSASDCTFSSSWPFVTFTNSGDRITSVTDAENRTIYYSYTNSQLSGIRMPTSSINTVELTYEGVYSNRVKTLKRGGQIWTYNYPQYTGITTVTDPMQHIRSVVSDRISLLSSSTNEDGETTYFDYCGLEVDCPWGLLKKITYPEGNSVNYRYDARGNRTKETLAPKTGSSETSLFTSATYSADCTNQKICNKPLTTTDQAGQVTTYEYDASSGMVSKVTAPPPQPGWDQPETRTTFTTLQASVKNASNAVVLAPAATRYIAAVSACAGGNATNCVGTANETRTTFSYEAATSSRGTNVLLSSVTTRSGNTDAEQTQTINFTYGDNGDLTSRSDGAGNVIQMRYNQARQMTDAWTPDPDGTGTLRPRATRTTYGSNGLPDAVVQGTIDYDGNNFTGLQYRSLSYDVYSRLIFDKVQKGSNNYALTQIGYDSLGRTDCVAQRMDASLFDTLVATPIGACSLSAQGASGPDRITKYEWDDASQLKKTISGYGTSVQRVDAQYDRNLNGSVTKATDGKGNVTAYQYDGYDRPLRTCFNSPTCTSASADKIALTYGTTGNGKGRAIRTSVRGGSESVYTEYTFDALGRAININYPGTSTYDPDVNLAYDNLGRLTQAQDANGQTVWYSYDALSRVRRQGNPNTMLSMKYDGAGRRTRLAWGDDTDAVADFYVTYDYDATGAMKTIKESGSTALATFNYEALGRRSSMVLGNGATTTYNYTGLNLTGMGINLAGANTTYDQALTYSYNAAGQIAARISSNAAYAWTGHVNINRGYTANALNQYTQIGSLTPVYDAKGNLTSTSSPTYTYNVNNALVSSSAGNQFYQDPIGRLRSIGNGSGLTRSFEYDGVNIVSERRPSDQAIQHRYIFGPGVDEALVWYDYSSGTLVKKFLTADERGSIVAVTNSSGAVLGLNSYDEYGIPASGNLGMFQFTGQAWLPELGMYSYKARMYSPTLGRFMQTDPTGYADGMNWYDYVSGDPVNMTDPSGTRAWGMAGLGLDVTELPGQSLADLFVNGSCGEFCTSFSDSSSINNLLGNVGGDSYLNSIDMPQSDLFGDLVVNGAKKQKGPIVEFDMGTNAHGVLFQMDLGGWAHIFMRHVLPMPGKSQFSDKVQPEMLMYMTLTGAKGKHQANGNVTYSRQFSFPVGTDQTGSPTRWVTVVTDHVPNSNRGLIVTSYPGLP